MSTERCEGTPGNPNWMPQGEPYNPRVCPGCPDCKPDTIPHLMEVNRNLHNRIAELEEKLATLQQTYQEFQATYGLTLETDNPDKPGTLGFLLAENAALQRALQDAADRFHHLQQEFKRLDMPVGAALAGVYEENARNLLTQRRKP